MNDKNQQLKHNLPDMRLSEEKKIYGVLSPIFYAVSAAVLSLNYFIQLTVIQPGLQKGEEAFLSLLSLYNPHGIFIALEDLGYLMMSVSF